MFLTKDKGVLEFLDEASFGPVDIGPERRIVQFGRKQKLHLLTARKVEVGHELVDGDRRSAIPDRPKVQPHDK